jgi:hypothetical protein
MEVVWIYYGFRGAIANFVVWISLFFPLGSAGVCAIFHDKSKKILETK